MHASTISGGMKDQILELLGTGLPEATVASAVGCTAGYISQLLADQDFRNQVLEKRVLALQQISERDSRYDRLEDRLLERLEEIVPFMSRAAEVTRAIQVVNSAKRRGSPLEHQAQLESTRQVVLNMPVQIIQQFQLSPNNEVIAVEGKPMITASSGQVSTMAEVLRLTEKKGEVLENGAESE